MVRVAFAREQTVTLDSLQRCAGTFADPGNPEILGDPVIMRRAWP